ncbi:MAG: hypothetical protein KDC67_02065 [Ignavibacteriae bacterium]|nr:hypothetical protein [Ignavibacteriota bacterium]MCB0748791.1 hypothetical protein [Ignavibacteriota bacterium]
MLFNTQNDLKSVAVLIKEKDQPILKSILDFLRDKYKDFTLFKYRTGAIGEDLLISFKVKAEYYSTVLEKFAYNDIHIIVRDKNDSAFIDEKREHKTLKLRSRGWKEIGKETVPISFQELEQFANEGRIKEVAKEARGGIGTSTEIAEKARNILSTTIDNAINNLLLYAEENQLKQQNAVDELLNIATDSDLKLFQKRNEIIKAGEAAIAISTTNEKLYDNLVAIANNTKLENILNVKATVCLAAIILESENIANEQEMELTKRNPLPDVNKELNTRWLKIAYETVFNKLNQEEKNSFNQLISFIEEKRKVA